jgi:hypothetical protein
MRKIIQISAVPATEASELTVFALCDDGSLWGFDSNTGAWNFLSTIPQDN